jgi:hypothetical protein
MQLKIKRKAGLDCLSEPASKEMPRTDGQLRWQLRSGRPAKNKAISSHEGSRAATSAVIATSCRDDFTNGLILH